MKMSYTTFLGDTFEDEHDEELCRKFGDTYKFFKNEYPGLYKLPTEDVRDICYKFRESPYGDTFEKSVDRTKQYINQRMPEWNKKYINPTKQSFNDSEFINQKIGNHTLQMTKPLDYVPLGTENKFQPYPQTPEYPQYFSNEFFPDGNIDFREVRKRVEKDNPVFQQEFMDFFSQKQMPINFAKSIYDLYKNAKKFKSLPLHDKYKHGMINCLASQKGLDGLTAVSLASQIKEWNDIRKGSNTQSESEQDMEANFIGSYLGSLYPHEDCEKLLKPYISKKYPYSAK